ncbi:hypothetical protein PSTH1771_10300 [Pseudomonas syringae pv. theae]|uniref:hypothetical protein n=1 Tax=Pseudomonas syringae group TaxID=136849 RepID=UPI0023C0AF9B|nr:MULTISPECIES: hypothetical protein [Pseudomonas syringae group]MDU8630762.1 hypothetical protein [Pseudomonas syringae group sp. 243L2]GKS05398.1 hypothetical protein PSTH1771_10300 [Pseudomonas syringae pv. theae]
MSSASSMKVQVSRTQGLALGLGNWVERAASAQTYMGRIIDQSFPSGLTGIIREHPRLILTVDDFQSVRIDSSLVVVAKNIVSEEVDQPELSFKTQLADVQAKLGLSVTQVAQLFGVTRKSVYDWFEGSEPRSAYTKILDVMLSVISEHSVQFNLQRLKNVWLTPLSGSSFMDVIQDESLDEIAKLNTISKKIIELAPRLGSQQPTKGSTYLGSAHVADIDRVADFG